MRKIKIFSLFNISLAIKALDGLIEIASCFVLLFINDEAILKLFQKIADFTAENISDQLSYKILHQLFYAFNDQAKNFLALVLLVNGIVKIVLSVSLILRKRWSFPVSIAVLSGLIIYQLIESILKHSIVIHIINVFDIIVLILIIREYINFNNGKKA